MDGNLPGDVFAEAGLPTVLVIFFFLAAFLGALLVLVRSRARQLVEEQQRDEVILPLDQKIDLVAVTSEQLSRLNAEIREEFQLQLIETRRLQKEAADATEVAALKADAIASANKLAARALTAVLDGRAAKDKRFQIWLAIGSFFAGVVVTVITTIVSLNTGG